MSNKLTRKDKLEIAVESSLQLIPYVGASLSTAYFSTKQEKRFKRLESFYQELSDHINTLQPQIIPFAEHDEESLIALIERLNSAIEKEHSRTKRSLFRKFFINTLSNATLEDNYDERQMFLDALADMTQAEFKVLLKYYNERTKKIALDSDIEFGARARLEMQGFLVSHYRAITSTGTSPIDKNIAISPFGIKFVEFCAH
ncbi:hypothetical protein [Viridibacillus sp. FSL H8-0110]|uniref:hypothetical protein n=1 Tax=Viridibacillus sp. FSL H8-0110 TaxID=2921376 RepID=UPI0030FCC709